MKYKDNPTDIDDQILEELDNFHFEPKTKEKEASGEWEGKWKKEPAFIVRVNNFSAD